MELKLVGAGIGIILVVAFLSFMFLPVNVSAQVDSDLDENGTDDSQYNANIQFYDENGNLVNAQPFSFINTQGSDVTSFTVTVSWTLNIGADLDISTLSIKVTFSVSVQVPGINQQLPAFSETKTFTGVNDQYVKSLNLDDTIINPLQQLTGTTIPEGDVTVGFEAKIVATILHTGSLIQETDTNTLTTAAALHYIPPSGGGGGGGGTNWTFSITSAWAYDKSFNIIGFNSYSGGSVLANPLLIGIIVGIIVFVAGFGLGSKR